MTAQARTIHLVTGPPLLVGTTVDVGADPCDAADLDPATGRFVRATDGRRVVAFSTLRPRCTHHAAAEELATVWRLLVFVPARRPRRSGVQPYRYEGAWRLVPTRGHDGDWVLAAAEPCPRTASARARVPTGPRPTPPPASGPVPPASTLTGRPDSRWAVLARRSDDSAARVATLLGLLPPGPLAARAGEVRHEIERAAADARRLATVGAALDHGLGPGADGHGAALDDRIAALLAALDGTVDALVDLHLSLGDPTEPATSLHGLADAMAELRAPTPPAPR
jgi:hypothetical protein